jgi:hypothetical protein
VFFSQNANPQILRFGELSAREEKYCHANGHQHSGIESVPMPSALDACPAPRSASARSPARPSAEPATATGKPQYCHRRPQPRRARQPRCLTPRPPRGDQYPASPPFCSPGRYGLLVRWSCSMTLSVPCQTLPPLATVSWISLYSPVLSVSTLLVHRGFRRPRGRT